MDLHRADIRYRRQALLALIASLVLGLMGLYWLHTWLGRMGAGGLLFGEDRLGLWLLTCAISGLLILTCLVAGIGLLRLARRIGEGQRYPPADMRTARDVPIRRGEAALRMASTARLTAWFLLGLAVLLAGWGGWMLYLLG